MEQRPSSSPLDRASIPTEYQAGFERAYPVNPDLATRYIQHTQLGDPDADALMRCLAEHSPADGLRWLHEGVNHGPSALSDAPAQVRFFFEQAEHVPAWFEPERTQAGCEAFHRHSEMFLAAFVGAILIEGFCSLISKSFAITGRVMDQGVRRLKQNNRHLVDIMLPGGLARQGDGWKLSVRLRLVHARVRLLLQHSPEWEGPAWGLPLSAAHMAYSSCVFSALLLKRAYALGVRLSPEERDSFMHIWRYTAYLMGMPTTLAFDSEDSALALCQIGALCEPPPSLESIMMANSLINSAPLVVGIEDQKEHDDLVQYIYRVSRALIGDELADQLNYPPHLTWGVLEALSLKNQFISMLHKLFPNLEQKNRARQFQLLLDVSMYSDEGIRYRVPGRLHAERDGEL